MKIDVFQQGMARLGAMFQRGYMTAEDAERQVTVYWETLGEQMTDEQFTYAVRWALAHSTFFPAAAELLEHAAPEQESRGERWIPNAQESRAWLDSERADRARLLTDGLSEEAKQELRLAAFRAEVERQIGPRPKPTDGAVREPEFANG